MHRLYYIYNKLKNRDFIFTIPLVLLALDKIVGHCLWLYHSGKGFPKSDDSQWYLDYANALMTNFSIGLHMNDLMYLGYNILLTLLLALFKDPVAIVFVQAVTAGLSVILVFKISRMLFNRLTAIIASYFYYSAYDITLWTTYILSDSFFISLLLLCIYFLLKVFESNKKLYKVLFALTSLYMVVFRPTGVITIAFIIIYILIRMHHKTIFGFIRRYRFALGGVVTTLAAIGVYLLVVGKLDPLITSLQFNAKMVLYNIYAKGWIYDKSTPYDHYYRPDYTINIFNSLILSFLVNNWDDVSILYAKRVLAFMGRWVWTTDLTSLLGVVKFIKESMPVLLFLAGTAAAVVNGVFRRASVIWLIILAVFVFCILLFIDAMYRYRAPAVPFIAIAAAYGADQIIKGGIALIRRYGADKIIELAIITAKKQTGKLSRYGKRKSIDSDSGF